MRVTVVCTLPNVATNVYIDEVTAREVVVTAMIGDQQITTTQLKADAIDGMKITGVEIIGGEIKTTEVAAAVAARMGPATIWDNGNTYPGIGFVKIGTNDQYPAGMYSADGTNLSIINSSAGVGPASASIHLISPKGTPARAAIASEDVRIDGSNAVEITSLSGFTTVNGYAIDSTPWNPLTCAGTWTNYTGGGGYLGGIRCRRVGQMLVIQGMIKNSATATNTTITTLPAEFIPQFTTLAPVTCGSATTARGVGHIIVSNAGTVTYDSGLANPTFVAINISIPL